MKSNGFTVQTKELNNKHTNMAEKRRNALNRWVLYDDVIALKYTDEEDNETAEPWSIKDLNRAEKRISRSSLKAFIPQT